jgi:hypothetical protein
VTAGEVDIDRIRRELEKRAPAQPRRARFNERPRQHGDGLAAALAVVEKGGVVWPPPVRDDDVVVAEFY